MKKILISTALSIAVCYTAAGQGNFSLEPVTKISTAELSENFRTPPGEAGITCYWWWLNGVATKESITRDLEEMKAKGYGSAALVDAGGFNPVTSKPTPGEVFMSPGWMELYRHAVREADRLGITLGVNVTSGWNPGGPYVTPEYALKKLTYSEKDIKGGRRVEVELDQPPTWYIFEDVCVQAVRKNREGAPVKQEAIPHWWAKTFNGVLGFQEVFPLHLLRQGFNYDPGVDILKEGDIIDISEYYDGKKLRWDAPEGEWTIIRYAWTCTAAHTSTTSDGWSGLSVDHLSPEGFGLLSKNVIEPLIKAAQEVGNSVKFLMTDSWEMGMVNWTQRFPEEFARFRGYDIRPYLPVMTGRVVGSPEISNRFLQDLRRTVSDCILNYHYKLFAELAHEHGMLIDPEAGGPCYTPVDAMEVMGVCDIPHGEYWARSPSHVASEGARLSVRQSACIAHTNGKRFVEAEGPTTIGPHWERSPADLKGIIDRIFCSGVNRLMWHTFTSSPEEYGTPGIEYFAGTHLNPQTTWWEQAADFVGYIDRCQYLLQQGLFVGDVLYYTGDDVPNMVFLKEEVTDLDFGYDWDKCSKDVILNRLSFSDGKIRLPDGMSYSVLVLPPHEQIDLEVMRKLEQLVLQGMVLIGDPPTRTTGLAHYPEGDKELEAIRNRMWRCNMGGWMDGVNRTENVYGKGRVIRGQQISAVLASMSVIPDFGYTSKNPDTTLDYIHRATDEQDIYFVTNRFAYKGINDYFYRYMPTERNRYENVECRFRVTGRVPELWNPHTGAVTPVLNYYETGGYTHIPLHLAPEGSVFVVFREGAQQDHIVRIDRNTAPLSSYGLSAGQYPAIDFGNDSRGVYATVYDPGQYTVYWQGGNVSRLAAETMPDEYTLDGSWTVSFDPQWGMKEPVKFEKLVSWTESEDPEIRYFSGKAKYETEFSIAKNQLKGKTVRLDLGNVQDIAVITVNGHTFPVSWCAPYGADITPYVRAGVNTLSVDVVNLWPNRLIGDGKLPEGQRRTKSNVSKYDAPDAEKYMRVSGLLGPVTVSFFDRVDLPARKKQ